MADRDSNSRGYAASLLIFYVERVEVIREELADRYDELHHRLLDSITDTDIQKINAYQRIVSCGIITDKVRLLRGQATENHLVIHARVVGMAGDDWGDGHVVEEHTDEG